MRRESAGRHTTGPTRDGDPDPASATGSALFRQLAFAVTQLAAVEGVRSFRLPYPPAAQRALDHTVLRCLELNETPPKSLPELWEWCRYRAAGDPLFQVPASFITPDATLVHPVGLMPTRTCLELASHGPEGGMEQQALALLAGLEARCGSADGYRRCRTFLASHPVLHQGDQFQHGWSRAVWTRVKDLYRPLPESLVGGDVFLRCSACGLPARLRDPQAPVQGAPVSGPDTWCEGERCPSGQRLDLIREPAQALLLRPSLRAFLALPYRVEEAALDELDRAGIGYEPIPGCLSAYWLREEGPGGLCIQIHDRVQPALLAARCAEAVTPLPDRTLVVVPQRTAERDGCANAFYAALPDEPRARIRLTTPQDLVRHIPARPAAAGGTGCGRSGEPTETEERTDA